MALMPYWATMTMATILHGNQKKKSLSISNRRRAGLERAGLICCSMSRERLPWAIRRSCWWALRIPANRLSINMAICRKPFRVPIPRSLRYSFLMMRRIGGKRFSIMILSTLPSQAILMLHSAAFPGADCIGRLRLGFTMSGTAFTVKESSCCMSIVDWGMSAFPCAWAWSPRLLALHCGALVEDSSL